MAETKNTFIKEIPLNTAKLITSEEPCKIGTNFQQLTNMRYGDTAPESISGMTKINSAAVMDATYLKTRSAFQYNKERRFVSKGSATSTSANNLVDSAATFTTGRKVSAGDIVLNTTDNTQTTVSSVTDINTLALAGDIFVSGETYEIFPEESHTLVQAYNTGLTASALLDNQTVVPNTGNFDATDLYVESSGGGMGLFSDAPQGQVAYCNGVDTLIWSGKEKTVARFISFAPGDGWSKDYTDLVTNTLSDSANVATLVKDGDVQLKFDSGGTHEVLVGDTIDDSASSTSGVVSAITLTGGTWAGGDASGIFSFSSTANLPFINNEQLDEGANANVATADGANYTATYMYVGSTRPIKGIKFYPKTANTTAGTMSVYYWNETTWVPVSSLSDGTATGGVSLAQVGIVSFNSTVSTAKKSLINLIELYWYMVEVTGCDNTTTISHVTLDLPVQQVKNIWDGTMIPFASAIVDWSSGGAARDDVSVPLALDEYTSGNTASYATIGSLGTNTADFIELGFTQSIQGVYIGVVKSSQNLNVQTMDVKYSNNGGVTWTSVTNIVDGTSDGGKTLNKSGYITWTPPSDDRVTVTEVDNKDTKNGSALYLYQFNNSGVISGGVSIYHVAGIPAPVKINGYKVPLLADNRLMLCNNADKEKNKVAISALYSPDVWNGNDTLELFLGNEEEITSAATLSSRLNSNIYDIKLFFKKNAIYGLTGTNPDNYSVYNVSSNIGCIAPRTLKNVTLMSPEGSKKAVVFQASDGIYIYDNSEPIKISNDIQNFWDKNESSTRKISTLYSDKSYGFVDAEKHEYHWCFADGASTGTLNREFVFDLQRLKWFEVSRGSGKILQAGISVKDTRGNDYTYGFIDTGYMERLENGTTQDGTNITSTMWTGDFLPEDSAMSLTQLKHHKLIMKTKATTTSTVTVTHYMDGKTTGTALAGSYDPTLASYNLTSIPENISILEEGAGNLFHSLKYAITTNDETVGFQPLFIGTKFMRKGTEVGI